MSRSVSATEAKNSLAALISWVRQRHDEVIVESHGEPTVAIISIADYEELKALRERKRREEAFARLRELARQISEQNANLTPEEADALADRFSHDLVEDLVAKGKVRFEE